MSRWQGLRNMPGAMLAVYALSMAPALGSGSTDAADPVLEKAKPNTGAVEVSPEQAAGGRENLKRLRKACETDVSRLCKNVRLGGGRILKCLREHESELEAGCREALGSGPSKP